MTEKEKLFVEEYLKNDKDVKKAYKTVYSSNWRGAYSLGKKILARPEVKKYLSEREREIAERHNITIDKVVRYLLTAVDGCVDEESRKITDMSNYLRAVEDLGKICGAFQEKTQVEHTLSEENRKMLESFVNEAKAIARKQRKKLKNDVINAEFSVQLETEIPESVVSDSDIPETPIPDISETENIDSDVSESAPFCDCEGEKRR